MIINIDVINALLICEYISIIYYSRDLSPDISLGLTDISVGLPNSSDMYCRVSRAGLPGLIPFLLGQYPKYEDEQKFYM